MRNFLVLIGACVLATLFLISQGESASFNGSFNGAVGAAGGGGPAFGDIIQSVADSNEGDLTLTFDQTATSGSLLVVAVFDAGGAATQPSGWSYAASVYDTPNADEGVIWFKVSDGTETQVVLASGSPEEEEAVFYEVYGPWAASPLDTTANSGPTETATISTGTTGTTAQADEFAVALFTSRDNGDSVTSWSNSFTDLHGIVAATGGGSKSAGSAYKILTSTGTVETTCTKTSTSSSMGVVATFKKQ